MRQVVNGAKGGPLLGHSSSIISAQDPKDTHYLPEEDDEDSCMSVDGDDHLQHPNRHSNKNTGQQRRRRPHSPKSKGPRQQIERERRLRREIANSNERRRMQSINQGYMSLKRMLPVTDSTEKLSKAAVLQNAADYMAQILEERQQLLLRNAELTQALGSQRREESAPSRKRDMTESSDEGIGLSYQPSSHESELVEELKRTVADLKHQLETESQRRAIIEQTYTYNLLAAQAASQVRQDMAQQIPTTVPAGTLSPPQSRHSSTDENVHERLGQAQTADSMAAASPDPQSFGKASSVASQNLSIIVEAINHLEGDQTADKEVDSGVSHGESSDESKSERSVCSTPQPPPAHQAFAHHRSRSASYTAPSMEHSLPAYCNASAPANALLYRPTFLSGYMNSQTSVASYIQPQ